VRPVNLIPPDSRRGDRSQLRMGMLSYVIVGALGAALLGIVVLGMTNKQISDRKAEVAQLTQQQQEVTARAQALQAFADFRSMQENRLSTVRSLAESRFDWQRVLEEFARIIPPDIWIGQLAGTVSPTVSVDGGPDIQMRSEINAPALEIKACAVSQDSVARFVSDLEDIDGVTRVGFQQSKRPDAATSGATGAPVSTDASGGGEKGDCTHQQSFVYDVRIVVAFDAVATPDAAAAAASATAAPAVPASSTSTSAGG
jgi:Tfp pilus assembly protein PilN